MGALSHCLRRQPKSCKRSLVLLGWVSEEVTSSSNPPGGGVKKTKNGDILGLLKSLFLKRFLAVAAAPVATAKTSTGLSPLPSTSAPAAD